MTGTKLKFGNEAKNRRPVELTRPADVRKFIETALDASLGSSLSAQIVRPGERVVILTSDLTRDIGSEYYLPEVFS